MPLEVGERDLWTRDGTEIPASYISVSPRRNYMLFSTRNPRAVQRIPWPDADGEEATGFQGNYDSWSVDEYNFPWLDCTDGVSNRFIEISTTLKIDFFSGGNEDNATESEH